MIRKWAVRRKHRIGPWWLCARCLVTREHKVPEELQR